MTFIPPPSPSPLAVLPRAPTPEQITQEKVAVIQWIDGADKMYGVAGKGWRLAQRAEQTAVLQGRPAAVLRALAAGTTTGTAETSPSSLGRQAGEGPALMVALIGEPDGYESYEAFYFDCIRPRFAGCPPMHAVLERLDKHCRHEVGPLWESACSGALWAGGAS